MISVFLLAFYFLSADQANYDGENLKFQRDFHIEHPLGKLQADTAILHRNLLSVEGNVRVDTYGETPFSIQSDHAKSNLPSYNAFSFLHFQEIQFMGNVKILSPKKLRFEGGSLLYKENGFTLLPTPPSLYCHLFQEEGEVRAHSMYFDLSKRSLHCTHAIGSMVLDGKECFALAEEWCYLEQEEKIVLKGDKERVLFWQEDLSLSAPIVEISLKQPPLIEGKGDVHFSFTLEEKHALEKIFSLYL